MLFVYRYVLPIVTSLVMALVSSIQQTIRIQAFLEEIYKANPSIQYPAEMEPLNLSNLYITEVLQQEDGTLFLAGPTELDQWNRYVDVAMAFSSEGTLAWSYVLPEHEGHTFIHESMAWADGSIGFLCSTTLDRKTEDEFIILKDGALMLSLPLRTEAYEMARWLYPAPDGFWLQQYGYSGGVMHPTPEEPTTLTRYTMAGDVLYSHTVPDDCWIEFILGLEDGALVLGNTQHEDDTKDRSACWRLDETGQVLWSLVLEDVGLRSYFFLGKQQVDGTFLLLGRKRYYAETEDEDDIGTTFSLRLGEEGSILSQKEILPTGKGFEGFFLMADFLSVGDGFLLLDRKYGGRESYVRASMIDDQGQLTGVAVLQAFDFDLVCQKGVYYLLETDYFSPDNSLALTELELTLLYDAESQSIAGLPSDQSSNSFSRMSYMPLVAH